MAEPETITVWLQQLKRGEQEAARQLWERYYHRLVALAQRKLEAVPQQAKVIADGEDVALSAFRSFCRQAENGKLPWLEDRNNLWETLVVFTVRKASSLRKYLTRAKRHWNRVESLDAVGEVEELQPLLYQIISGEPDPALDTMVIDSLQNLLSTLKDDELREIAELKLTGLTNQEISKRIGRSDATVERRLQLIRLTWEQKLSDDVLAEPSPVSE